MKQHSRLILIIPCDLALSLAEMTHIISKLWYILCMLIPAARGNSNNIEGICTTHDSLNQSSKCITPKGNSTMLPDILKQCVFLCISTSL